MKVELVDINVRGIQTMVDAIGVCRGKECTEETIYKALEAKPVPHMAILEFGWIMLKAEGVSVKTRIQLERHRLYSSMERSTRSLDMTNEEVIIPESVNNKAMFKTSLERIMQEYIKAIGRGESYEDASYLLPLAITTKFNLSGNLRTWFEYFQKRLCKKHVQDEHYRLAMEMYKLIKDKFPIISKAVPCKACGKCGEKE